MLSCSRQVAQDIESRCYPGQSLIWTSASEKTHMTHGVSARKQFAWNQWNERHRHCVNLYFCTNTWLFELKASEQAGRGLTNGLPKQKWGENGRPWTLRQIDITSPTVEQMSAIPCFEAHMDTLYPHTHIHRNIQDNFFGQLISGLLLPFLKPNAAPSEDFLHRIKSGDRWNY